MEYHAFPVVLSKNLCYYSILMRGRAVVFKTPPMSASIRAVTYGIAALPFLFAFFGFRENNPGLLSAAIFMVLLIGGVWLWMRPSEYSVDSRGMTIVWPLRKFHIARSSVTGVRVLDKNQLKKEIGFAVRIGVGGLFGGFGLLWSRKRGFIRFYISRLDSFLMIEQRNGSPLLITVDNPDRMLRDLETHL